MASGTIDNGSFSGAARNQARPLIVWSSTTNVANNTSSVTATLVFRKISAWHSFNLNGHSVTITINGNSASASRTFDIRPNGDHTIWSRTITVTHNSDGAKSISIGASGNTGVRLGSYNFSQTVTLDTIPRASSLSAFSFNAHLKSGTENRINYTVNRRSSSFRHQIQLRDGSTTVHQWDNISSDGSSTLTLTASQVNTLLNRMSSSTAKSFTLRIATRSGVNGGWIGSAVTRNATATVHTDERPSLSALSVSEVGNSISTDYLQTISKVKASFTRSAGYGASITSSRIIVRRASDGGNSQTMNSNSGTTSNAISLVGTYEVVAQATDSRGRSGTQLRTTFTSVAYSPPVITSFTATRQSNEGEASRKIDWHRVGRHSGLSGKNSATGLLQYRTGDGAWIQIESVVDSGGTWNKEGIVEGLSETNSYEFRFTLTDSFGYSDSQTITVSTARVVLDIHKNEGVGIGKLHEKGVLDVDGTVYMNGKVMALGGLGFEDTRDINEQPQEIPPQALSFAFKLASNIGYPPERANPTYAHILNIAGWTTNEGSGGFPMQMSIGREGISLRQGTSTTTWSPWSSLVSTSSGSNSNGYWVRFGDGTQICWHRWTESGVNSHSEGNGLWRTGHIHKDYAKSFIAIPSVTLEAASDWRMWGSTEDNTSTHLRTVLWRAGGSIGDAHILDYIAIGRWK